MITEPAQPASVLNRLLARRGLIFYFLLTFSFSWLMFLPGLLMYYGVLNLSAQAVRWFAIAGLLGPILSGFIMTGVIEGWPGISRLLRRIVRWRVGLRWYLFALIGLPAVMVLATIIRPGALESLDVSGQPIRLAYLKAFVCMAIMGGPLFEEPGWTGFAQPRLQQMYGPLLGGLIAWWPLGTVALAWILDPVRRHKGHSSAGYRSRFCCVCLGSRGSALNYHLGGQQHERQRAYGYPGARLLEHLLCYESDPAFPHSGRAWQLLEPDDSRVRIGVSADCGDAGTDGLPERRPTRCLKRQPRRQHNEKKIAFALSDSQRITSADEGRFLHFRDHRDRNVRAGAGEHHATAGEHHRRRRTTPPPAFIPSRCRIMTRRPLRDCKFFWTTAISGLGKLTEEWANSSAKRSSHTSMRTPCRRLARSINGCSIKCL